MDAQNALERHCLIEKNGALAEADVYDGYGKVKIWDYSPGDFNRDGTVNGTDQTTFNAALLAGGANKSTPDPMSDLDGDGDTDLTDAAAFTVIKNAGGAVAQRYVSSIGNPFFFTGRRLYMLETLPEGASVIQANQQLQHNRARHYAPLEGRWLQRDPAEYVDGSSLFEYCGSRVHTITDPSGAFWSFFANHHAAMTRTALADLNRKWCIDVVVSANSSVDGGAMLSDPARHFDDEMFSAGLSVISEERQRITANDPRLTPVVSPSCCDTGIMQIVLEAFGRQLHTRQDFYSHSNWVEHYAPRQWPPAWDFSTIPYWLTSGYYPDYSVPYGKLSHHLLNKDSETRYFSPSGTVQYPRGTGFGIAYELALSETFRQASEFRSIAPNTYKCCAGK